MKKISFYLFIGLTGVLFLAGCKKDDNAANTQSAEDSSIADTEASNAYAIVDRLAREEGVNKTSGDLPDCASWSIDTTASAKSITVDFGAEGCLCDKIDGKTRKGKIVATWTGRYRQEGTAITLNTTDYYVDNYKHSISKSVTNRGKNQAGNLTYDITVNNQIETPEGTISWSSSRTREWVAGDTTILNIADDEYLITDKTPTTGKNRKGDMFTSEIMKPIRIDLSCRSLVTEGSFDLTTTGAPTMTVDYGDGACDRKFTATVNGKTYNLSW